MPLIDHFRPPLSVQRHWESFHGQWAGALADQFSQDLLPKGYFAEIQVHVGGRFEVDLAALEPEVPSENRGGGWEGSQSTSTATATAPSKVWSPPGPDLHLPAIYPDVIETLVFSSRSGPTLVGAIELVSPGNKDRPEARRAFAAKCAAYLQEGIGVIAVDIVTDRRANLHDELVALLDLGDESRMPGSPPLYATAYRPTRSRDREGTDVWLAELAVGRALPTLPLALRGGPCLPVDLESSYAGLCGRIRLPISETPP